MGGPGANPGYTWPWEARPGPKKPDPARPDAAPGPGSGLDFEPEGQAGPVPAPSFLRFFEGWAGPARSPTGFYVFGPGSGSDGGARQGPGLGFLRRAWLGSARSPARPEVWPGIMLAQLVWATSARRTNYVLPPFRFIDLISKFWCPIYKAQFGCFSSHVQIIRCIKSLHASIKRKLTNACTLCMHALQLMH